MPLANMHTKKEVLICDADDSDSTPNGECWETVFGCEATNYDSYIGTRFRWKGKVRITIEQLQAEPESEPERWPII